MNPSPLIHQEGALFIDGPVSVCVSAGTETEILEAYERLSRLVRVCAKLTGERHTATRVPSKRPEPSPPHGNRRRTDGE